MKITFPDQTTNELNIYEADDKNAPVLILFSAMGVKASYYRHFAAEIIESGIHVVTVDQRGNDKSSVRPSRSVNFGYKEIVEVDYPHIVNTVNSLFPNSKKVIMGHSLGGQLGSLYAAKYPETIDGLILNASCSVYYKGWDGMQRHGVYFGSKMCKLVAGIMGYYPGKVFGFGGTEARSVINDWHHTAMSGKYEAANSDFDYEAGIQKLNLPVLAISYEGDTASPKRALDNLCEKFTDASLSREHVVHPDAPEQKYNHYSWVREPSLSIPLIQNWLKEKVL